MFLSLFSMDDDIPKLNSNLSISGTATNGSSSLTIIFPPYLNAQLAPQKGGKDGIKNFSKGEERIKEDPFKGIRLPPKGIGSATRDAIPLVATLICSSRLTLYTAS